MKGFVRDILVTALITVVIFVALQATVQSFIVVGSSMQPNFTDGERIIINKLFYLFHEPERGDVIVFHPPESQQADYIKRVIGLPGDAVEIKDGIVYIYTNDKSVPLDEEDYIKYLPNYNMPRRTVPENSYFVLGDNRPHSNDSHNNWTVPRENIIGKVWLSIWPPGEAGFISNYSLEEQVP